MEYPTIVLLDCHPSENLGNTLRKILDSSCNSEIQYQRESSETCDSAFYKKNVSQFISRIPPEVILLVVSLRFLKQARELIQSIKRDHSEIPILVVIEDGNADELFGLLKLGVADFLTPPLTATNILPRMWRVLNWERESESPTQQLKEKLGLQQFVGENAAFLKEIRKIPMVAKCDVSVLILGETGTGKELGARAIHYLSPRTHKPFIPVNCGAIPTELIENELFGHERGAFTSAFTAQRGLIQEADGGTLLLDEIDCLPPCAQVKLLRFLQEEEYRPLGSPKMHQVDVRIIASTNMDVEAIVSEGKLRKDLYYRLNVIPLILPPLRDRPEDIPLLARHFLAKYGVEFERQVTDLSSNAMQKLMLYDWPGNVRELENIIQRALVLSTQTVIRDADIVLPTSEPIGGQESFQEAKARVIEQFERRYIQELLLVHRGNITQTAQAAQKNRRAFWQLIQKHHIDIQKFKPAH